MPWRLTAPRMGRETPPPVPASKVKMQRSSCVFFRVHSRLILLLLPALAQAAIWPEEFAGARRASAQPAVLSDRAIWDEYGLKESETAAFEADGRKFTATAWRLQD